MSETKITSASVKVMLSYDYGHFEVNTTLGNDNGLTIKEIDEARKTCQRLADKGVAQYKVAKNQAAQRVDGDIKARNFEAECKRIKLKQEEDRTIKEIAMLKQYEDESWRSQFDMHYDYDDDEQYRL